MRSRWYHSLSTGEPTIAATINEKEDRATRRLRALRRWRRIQACAGLALAAGFFLPLMPRYVPAQALWRYFHGLAPIEFTTLMFRLLTCAGAYTFGLFVLVGSIRRRTSHDFPSAKSITIIFYGAFLGLLLYQMLWNWGRIWGEPELFVRFPIVVAGCLAFVVEWLFRERRLLCTTWYITLIQLVWFGNLIYVCSLFDYGTVTHCGSWVGLTAALVLCGAVWAEAMIRTRAKPLRTLLNIATCRLHLLDPTQPCCPDCGYLLIGLTSNRCPECGLEFDPAEHGLDTGRRTDHRGRQE